jgi:hypothetical protein
MMCLPAARSNANLRTMRRDKSSDTASRKGAKRH